MKVSIIGGGVNGICSAYYLNKSGFEVEIFDAKIDESGTSYGNAGMIVPSHFMPMASPGVISKGLRWMFDSASPFYIKPRANLELITWLWNFYKSCNAKNVTKYQDLIWRYNDLSKQEYASIAKDTSLNFDYHEKGLLMLYRNEKSKKEEIEMARKAEQLGLAVKILDQEGVQKLNPDTTVDVLGGVHYPGDAHLYSNHFMTGMISYLRTRGVQFISSNILSGTMHQSNLVSVQDSNGDEHKVDQVVLSSGVWTGKLLKSLGIKIHLIDGKGYSVTQNKQSSKPTIPSILTEEKVAITPMKDDLRITGTLEISGISRQINKKRVKAFLSAVPSYFPDIAVPVPSKDEKIWVGYRPLTPDGVPYVGRLKGLTNTVLATGHGMMGMSLGPGTGKIVSEIIAERSSDLDLDLLAPGRF